MNKKGNRGITLMVLIITVIILAILTGVSIDLIVDEKVFDKTRKEEKEINSKLLQEQEKINGILAIANEANELVIYREDDGNIDTPPIVTATEIYIYTVEDLKWLQEQVNEQGNTFEGYTIYLENDLDMGARPDEEGNWKTEQNEAREWVAIGKSSTMKATFDGKGHIIKGIYINDETSCNGMFGNSNTIKNLSIKDSYIEGGTCTGGIVGALREGEIVNCHNIDTTIILKDGSCFSVGGVVGQAQGIIKNCTNTGEVKGLGIYIEGETIGTNCGGIVGATYSLVEDCYNKGMVIGEAGNVGGIAGYARADINKCYNLGRVEGKMHLTGGVVGNPSTTTTITKCYNKGEVRGVNYTGGISGRIFETIDNCYNMGNVIGSENYIGGISGVAEMNNTNNSIKGSIKNSYNTGNVSGNNYIGGVAGANVGTIENCYSLDISSTKVVGFVDKNSIKTEAYIKTETEMKNNNFVTLLGEDNWEIKSGENGGYPILK